LGALEGLTNLKAQLIDGGGNFWRKVC
jgi:hypothetical protein